MRHVNALEQQPKEIVLTVAKMQVGARTVFVARDPRHPDLVGQGKSEQAAVRKLELQKKAAEAHSNHGHNEDRQKE